ncbi:odorant receptor 131-2-like [Rhinophrynus dorsalis]
MNSSTNASSSNQLLDTVKAFVYLVDFIVCTVLTIIIVQTVWRDSTLKKEVRFFLLCHHLICLTLFFGIGTIFTGIRALRLNAPVLVCWIIFAVQIVIGRGLLMTLLLMALNTCIAVCWPLKYLAFVHSVKRKILACLWFISFLDPTLSMLYESIRTSTEQIVRGDPNCPTTLASTFSRITGMIFIVLLLCFLLVSYVFIIREGRRAGHFNSSNHHAKRTILIHGLQIVLHILPTFVNIGIGGMKQYIVIDLISFIIFSCAQCSSPVVYGFRCTELRHKLIIQRQHCCAGHVLGSNTSVHFRNG